MYAPPADRTSPLLAQLARLQAVHAAASHAPFAQELAAARNEVAHYTMSAGSPAPRLPRRNRFQAVAFA